MKAAQTSKKTSAELAVAEAIVVLGFLLACWAALSILVGNTGLGLVSFAPQNLAVDEAVYEMSIETEFSETAEIRLVNAPTWADTETGTHDAATGGSPVAVDASGGFVSFVSPSPGQQWAWVAWHMSTPLLGAGVLFVIWCTVRSARRTDPFTKANARRLYVVAGLVGVGGTAVNVLGQAVRRWLLDTSAASELVVVDAYFSFAPLVIGTLIAALATVWRRGVQLSEELEGVV